MSGPPTAGLYAGAADPRAWAEALRSTLDWFADRTGVGPLVLFWTVVALLVLLIVAWGIGRARRPPGPG